ncbi:hypothetical protein GJ631_10645 [Natronomonas sp. CBA1123]|nr:hypothetical protein [Natronomonas sp. CBA1123]MUV87012.1 hypothetical protein [Natronomonas sp. CBA1123]
MSRKKLDIPEGLQQWVEETFGDGAVSDAEAYRMALMYARERYRAEHGDE